MDLSNDFFFYVIVGFAAQIIDGALGMAFGVVSSTVLLSAGQSPVIISASIHTAEMAITAFSASSHMYFKNVCWRLCLPLALFGAMGGVGGAMFLMHIDADAIKPFISLYLGLLGLVIIWKGLLKRKETPSTLLPVSHISALGIGGGALDACGGGGWGPIVTSNLIARGDNPRLVIGSVNTSEFIVSLAITVSFITTIGFHFSDIVAGLLLGGIIAAPLGAYMLRIFQPKTLMIGVGCLITILSGVQIFNYLT